MTQDKRAEIVEAIEVAIRARFGDSNLAYFAAQEALDIALKAAAEAALKGHPQ